MMTAAPAKFTFDTDMSLRREKTVTLTQSQLDQMLEDARTQGSAEGFTQGENGAVSRAAQSLQRAAEQLAQQAIAMLGQVDELRQKARQDAALIGKTIGTKLAAHLVARTPEAELDALIADCMASLQTAPHLAVRCHPDLADKIKEIAEHHINASGFSGRLVVMGEPEIELGDGRLEWVDGGLVRDQHATAFEIDAIIGSWLDANTPETMTETGL